MSNLTQVGPALYLSKAMRIDAYVDQNNQQSSVVDFFTNTTVKVTKTPALDTDAVNKTYVDQLISTLTSSTTTNETSIQTAKTQLNTSIGDVALDLSNEISRATAAESALTTSIGDVASDLSEEVSRATAAESALNTKIETELTVRQTFDTNIRATTIRSTRIMPMDATVYADAEQPTPKELISTSSVVLNSSASSVVLNYDGWYFRNNVLGKKINWYVGTHPNTTLGDIKALMLDNLVIKKTSPVFITLYTARTGLPGEVVPHNGASWYKSRLNYIVNNTNVLTEFQPYRFLYKLDPTVADIPGPNGHNIINLTLDESSSRYKDVNGISVSNNSDKILFFAISSDSSSSAGNVETIIKNFSLQTVDGVYENLFTDASVSSKFYAAKIQALYTYFFQKNIIGADFNFLPTA